MKKKTMLILSLFIVVLVSGGLGYRAWANNQSANSTELSTSTIARGSLASSLSSSGNTRSGQTATILWETSGKVGVVNASLGEIVQEDQVLAALDTTSLSSEMIQARLDLLVAEQALDDLLNSTVGQAQALQAVENAQEALDNLQVTDAEALSQAQLTVVSAQEALEDAEQTRLRMNYPHTSDSLVIEKAEMEYMLAKQAYKEAQQAYYAVDQKRLTNPDRVRALTNLLNAKQQMESKLAIYNWYLLGYTESDIAQADAELGVAQANLEKAQSALESLKNGNSSAAISLAEAVLADAKREWERVKNGPTEQDIAAAQATVEAAQAKLDHAQLLAPFTGTITKVEVAVGDLVSSGLTAFRIDDLAAMYIDLQISEVDLPSLEVGQAAIIEFDAISDKEYAGEVTEIGMIGTVSQGVVNYTATVRITNADSDIRPGMTASVSIIIAQVEDALLVPNKAIRTSNGQRTVTVLFEGQQISVPVTIGLVGDSLSEVTSDQVREGDVVVLTGTTASTTSTNERPTMIFSGGGPEGGVMIERVP